MSGGDRSSYIDKQKHQAAHIEEGNEMRGVSEKSPRVLLGHGQQRIRGEKNLIQAESSPSNCNDRSG